MTNTFTLTGRILDAGKRPVRRALLVLTSSPGQSADAAVNEFYLGSTPLMTDDDGYLRRRTNGQPDTGPVVLLTERTYSLRSAGPERFTPLVFPSRPANTVVDLADLIAGDLPYLGLIRDPNAPGLLLLTNRRRADGGYLVDGLPRDTDGNLLIGA